MADHFLTQNQQFALAIETVPGTAEILVAGDVKLKPFQSQFSYAPEPQRFTNDEVSDDLAQAADFVSAVAGRISVGFQAKTGGVVGTAPALGRILRACGMKEQLVEQITIGAPAGGDGIFEEGATYSATGGKTGIIEKQISAGGTLRYIAVSGGSLASGNVITVGPDSATASSSSTPYAMKYTPTSSGLKTATLQRAIKNDQGTAGQDFLNRLKGAMGTGVFNFAALDAARFQGEFLGAVDFDGAGSFFTGFTYEAGSAPKFINSTCQLNGVAVDPAAIGFDLGNVLELDPSPTTIGGPDGYETARIARREPKITIDPKRLKPGDFDDLGFLKNGNTFATLFIFGTTPNIIEISAPAVQIRADTLGIRAGLEVGSITAHVCRASLTDLDYAIYFR